jgi:hypothetical protein
MIDEGATPLKTRSPQITLNVRNDNGECIELHGATTSEYTARTWDGDIQIPCKTVHMHIVRDLINLEFSAHPLCPLAHFEPPKLKNWYRSSLLLVKGKR